MIKVNRTKFSLNISKPVEETWQIVCLPSTVRATLNDMHTCQTIAIQVNNWSAVVMLLHLARPVLPGSRIYKLTCHYLHNSNALLFSCCRLLSFIFLSLPPPSASTLFFSFFYRTCLSVGRHGRLLKASLFFYQQTLVTGNFACVGLREAVSATGPQPSSARLTINRSRRNLVTRGSDGARPDAGRSCLPKNETHHSHHWVHVKTAEKIGVPLFRASELGKGR